MATVSAVQAWLSKIMMKFHSVVPKMMNCKNIKHLLRLKNAVFWDVCYVALVRIDVLEECIAFIRVTVLAS
jgi:LPS sulfotransferase NodH